MRFFRWLLCGSQCRAKYSSSADSAMLASSGESIPPCGVPVRESSRLPVQVMTPALRNALTSAQAFLSLILARRRPIRAVWSISSKHALMSASSTQWYFLVPDDR